MSSSMRTNINTFLHHLITHHLPSGMEKTSKDQYGRKLWNVEAYEAEAKKGKKQDVSEEAKAAAQRLGSDRLKHRADLFQETVSLVKKRTLIADPASGRKQFGFVCPICDLSFRDTLALVDHINLPQHIKKAQDLARAEGSEVEEVSGGFRHASPEEVAQTIETLVSQKLREAAASKGRESMQERVKKRAAFMERRADRKREKRKRRKMGSEMEDSEMARTMGFGGFGSTKV